MSSIASYQSGANMASKVLGGAFSNNTIEGQTKIQYGTTKGEGNQFVRQTDGKLSASGNVSGISLTASFKFNSERADSNRVTYQAIQDRLIDQGHGEIANSFGWNFAYSKMMGKPITKEAIIQFFDQKVKQQQAKVDQSAKPKTSILAWLFSGWSSSNPIKQSENKTLETERKNAAYKSIVNKQTEVLLANQQQRVKEHENSNLTFLAKTIYDKGETYPDFKSYIHEANKQNKGELTTSDRKIVKTLEKYAQGNLDFSTRVNACFKRNTESIKGASTQEEAQKEAIKSQLSELYQEAVSRSQ